VIKSETGMPLMFIAALDRILVKIDGVAAAE
jgi:hypothetical protein